ncbi:hypothetical protein L1987_13250 [Smallanthus sonchifolius]|uniref:Uncharacterized protein n=1 Tax=Smallanthus sonchifolius TaxID=185202 RepID=A0ACB9JI67_9ASTR|nr:hypothetical protein L1987_13250 [Smallanthus sonchifolius]
MFRLQSRAEQSRAEQSRADWGYEEVQEHMWILITNPHIIVSISGFCSGGCAANPDSDTSLLAGSSASGFGVGGQARSRILAGSISHWCLAGRMSRANRRWLLIGLKNIFVRQLLDMRKEYIVRFVMDRSGETGDSFLANMSVGLATGQIKTGAPCQGERLAKYN